MIPAGFECELLKSAHSIEHGVAMLAALLRNDRAVEAAAWSGALANEVADFAAELRQFCTFFADRTAARVKEVIHET